MPNLLLITVIVTVAINVAAASKSSTNPSKSDSGNSDSAPSVKSASVSSKSTRSVPVTSSNTSESTSPKYGHYVSNENGNSAEVRLTYKDNAGITYVKSKTKKNLFSPFHLKLILYIY